MPTVRVPSPITGLTLSTSGALVPDGSNNIVCTVAEATALCYPPSKPRPSATNLVTGATPILFPDMTVLQSITTTGGTFAVDSRGLSATVDAASIAEICKQGFTYVKA